MKNSFKLHEKQEQKKKDEEFSIPCKPCCICEKEIAGAYGRHYDGRTERWTCSGRCERAFKLQQEADDDACPS